METLIAFWLICGAVSAIVASSRGANAVLAFIVGVALGPLGIIVAFVLKAEKVESFASADEAAAPISTTVSTAPDDRTYRKCPSCADFSPAEGKHCFHCGAALY